MKHTEALNMAAAEVAARQQRPIAFYRYAGKAKDMPRLKDSPQFALCVLGARIAASKAGGAA